MNKSKLKRLCRQSGMNVYDRDEEVQVAPCPYCGNDPGDHGNMNLNVSRGQYHSWCCDAGGRLEDFVREFLGEDASIPVRVKEGRKKSIREDAKDDLDAETEPAADVYSARNYLINKRGLTVGDLYRYNISVVVEEDHQLHPRILFPLNTYWEQEHCGWVARTYTNQRPKYLNWLEKREIVGYREGVPDDVHVLVEGLFDAIMVHKAGFSAAAMLGVTSGHKLREWAAFSDLSDRIMVVLDGDAHSKSQTIKYDIQGIRDTDVTLLPEDSDPADFEPSELSDLIHENLT